MSIGQFNPMSVEPVAGHIIELPVDQGAYLMQDNSVLSGPLQAAGGKSLIKPELAQHLGQHGYKTSVGRGGFTIGANDARWMGLNNARGGRPMTRKPPGFVGSQFSQSAIIPQSATGLISVGSRYTPSSVSAFGANAPTAVVGTGVSGVMGSQSGGSGGIVSTAMAGLGGVSLDRDANYRFAAAMNTSSRGRPRGRRPLRGQFPVVPIDMVRQLGIQQQVILQPAAPVAMRNKAVLCRPLSMCRKVQSQSSNQSSLLPSCRDNATSMQTDDADEFVHRRLQSVALETKSIQVDALQLDGDLIKAQMDVDSQAQARLSIDATTFTIGIDSFDCGIQTDQFTEESIAREDGEQRPEKPLSKFIPIPVPVPVYVPFPICLYACPVPYALPFPLPCLVPFPISPSTTVDSESVFPCSPLPVDQHHQSPQDRSQDPLVEASLHDEEVIVDEDYPVESDVPESINLATTTVERDSSDDDESEDRRRENDAISLQQRSLKRPAPSPDECKDAESTPTVTTDVLNLPAAESPRKATAAPEAISEPLHQPLVKRSRQESTPLSDTNYHLKFSYGINAWRHWVQQKLSALSGLQSSTHRQQYSYLRTDLVHMSETNLNAALSKFVREVRKPNNECYVADSIFYLCLGIQEYLNENGCSVNLFGGSTFTEFSEALDDILANFQPRVSTEGLLICRIEEAHLWEARQLGAQSPEVLLFSMLYFNTKHFGLRVGSAHHQLKFSQFELVPTALDDDSDQNDLAILCTLPGSILGGQDDDVTTLRLEPNLDSSERCPIQLFKAYLSRCPPETRVSDESFYFTPLSPSNVDDLFWYSNIPVKLRRIQIILNRIKMVKEIQEAFMNGQSDSGF